MDIEKHTHSALSAENEHLKKQLERYLNGELGGYRMGSDSQNSSSFIPNKVDSILQDDKSFPERIKLVLNELNDFSCCSRILLFHYNLTNKSFLALECSQGKVFPSTASSIEIDWNNIQSFLNKIENDVFESSYEKTDIPESLLDFFPNIKDKPQSILLIPFSGQNVSDGFITFEEDKFNRIWHPYEKDLLSVSAKMIAHAFQQNRDRTDNDKKEALNHYLLKVAELLSDKKQLNEQINSVFDITATFFGFGRMAIFQEIDIDHCQVTHEWHTKPFEAFGDMFQHVSYSSNLPGLKDLLDQHKIKLCKEEGMKSACKHLDTGNDSYKLFVPIYSSKTFWGFICIDDPLLNRKWSDFELNTLAVVSDILASAIERHNSAEKMKLAHNESVRLTKVLKEKEQFLETILSSVPVGIVLLRNREIIFSNNIISKISGINEKDLIGKNISDLYYSEQDSEIKSKQFYDEIDKNGIVKLELVFKDKSGAPVTTNIVGKQCPINGLTDSYLVIAQDITTLKQTQFDLNESEERSKIILETTTEGVFIFESTDKLLYVNDAGCKLLGYAKDEIGKIKATELFGEDDIQNKFNTAIDRISHGDAYKCDTKLRNSRGDQVNIELFGTSITIKSKPLFYISLRNITDRKRQERELMISEKKFRTLTENTKDHIIRISKEGMLLFGNNAFFNFYEISREDSIGLKISLLKAFPDAFSSALLDAGTYTSDESKKIEVTSTVGDEEYCVEWTISPETNGTLNIVSYLCVGREITQRKRWEEELCIAKEKAESADKLKSTFLANMSHEIRTPLNAIVGFSAMLKEVGASLTEKEEFIDIISKSSDNLMALITDIVDLAKIESGEFKINKKVFNLNELLSDTHRIFLKRMESEDAKDIKLILDIPDADKEQLIETDSNKLTQVFNNLLENAIKFTPEGSIRLGYKKEPGEFVFSVQDTGIGIAKKELESIFQPFRQANETIHANFGGTGLGLSICKHIIEALDGSIRVESKEEEGTLFIFTLPNSIEASNANIDISDLPAKKEIKEEKSSTPKNYIWTDRIVLLIDDNSSAHLQLRKFFEKTGVTLISARTLVSGRELIKTRRTLDLVLLDYNLSENDNHELICETKEIRKEMPVIALVPEEKTEDNSNLKAFNNHSQKPLIKEDLLTKMDLYLKVGAHQVV